MCFEKFIGERRSKMCWNPTPFNKKLFWQVIEALCYCITRYLQWGLLLLKCWCWNNRIFDAQRVSNPSSWKLAKLRIKMSCLSSSPHVGFWKLLLQALYWFPQLSFWPNPLRAVHQSAFFFFFPFTAIFLGLLKKNCCLGCKDASSIKLELYSIARSIGSDCQLV